MYKKVLAVGGVSIAAFALGLRGYHYYKNTFSNRNKDLSNTLWIETDLEPDDVLAIDILQKKKEIYAFVCGEGNSTNKMNRLLQYYSGTKTQLYIEGKESDKDFPEPYSTLQNDRSMSNIKPTEEYINELTKFSKNNGKTMIVIKPPRELYESFLTNPEETKKIMANMDCYMYGSFNLRSLKANSDQLKDFLMSFGTLYIFETHHAIGSSNSVNPDIFSSYKNLSNAKYFSEISKQWNDYILKDCRDTCNSITGRTDEEILSLDSLPKSVLDSLDENQKARYHRNAKCYKEVSKYNENQFVMADVGLALCFDKDVWTPVTIDFDARGYTKITKTENSNIKSIFNNGTLKEDLLKDLEILYEK